MEIKKWIFAMFLLFGVSAFCQDIIVLKTSDTIKAKITEVDGDAIRYKLHGYEDGPTITIYASNVSSITYENGFVQKINVTQNKSKQETTATSTTSQTSTNVTDFYKITEHQRLMSKARAWSTVGSVIFYLSLTGGVVVGIVSEDWLVGFLSCLPGLLLDGLCAIPANALEKQAKALVYTPFLEHEFNFESCSLSTSVGTLSSFGLNGNPNISLASKNFGAGISLKF